MPDDLLALRRRPLEAYLELLGTLDGFRFSRWGDGEWNAVLGRRRGAKNCDGHEFYEDLGDALGRVLRGYRESPAYMVGLQPLACRLMGDAIREFLIGIGWTNSPWHDADVFHRASIAGRVPEILDRLKGSRVIFVGPSYLEPWAAGAVRPSAFVPVPEKNCWKDYESVKRSVVELLRPEKGGRAVVAISFSMPAEVLIDDLDLLFPKQHAFVDFGSLWDPYAGRATRKYHRDLLETTDE